MLVRAKLENTNAGARQGDFIIALESLRGIAAVSVALFHSFHLLPVDGVRVYDRTIWNVPSDWQSLLLRLIMVPFNGGAAVSVFFVLSGYVLALSLRRDTRLMPMKSCAFLLRRFVRIYPTLAINILLIFVAVTVIGHYLPGLSLPQLSTRQLGENLLLQDFQVNGATWSLMIELAAIPFILLGFYIAQRWGFPGLFGLMLTAVIILFAKILLLHMLIAEYIFMFFAGMIVAEFWETMQIKLNRRQATSIIGLAVPVLLLARFVLGYTSKWSLLVEGLAATALVAAVIFGPRSALHGVLETRTLRFLGRISYSFYLYHPLTLYFALAIVASYDWLVGRALIGSIAIAIISVAATIPLAYASFALTERPMIRLSRRF